MRYTEWRSVEKLYELLFRRVVYARNERGIPSNNDLPQTRQCCDTAAGLKTRTYSRHNSSCEYTHSDSHSQSSLSRVIPLGVRPPREKQQEKEIRAKERCDEHAEYDCEYFCCYDIVVV